MVLLIGSILEIVKICFPGSSDSKESACNAGDPGSVPGLGKSPGEGNGNPFQYSCLENSMDRGAWWATDPRVTYSQTLLSDSLSLSLSHTHTHTHTMENSYQYIQLLKTISDINNKCFILLQKVE